MKSGPRSLFGRTAMVLALAFLLFLASAFVVIYRTVVLPVAKQSADDLAALIVLSAQTWVELPPLTRPAFEIELARRHNLRLTDIPIANPSTAPDFPFRRQIVSALSARLGRSVSFSGRSSDGSVWTSIPVGGRTLYAGFFPNRYAVHPPLAAVTLVSLGALLVLVTALVLVRRITVPLQRAARAAVQVGAGQLPAPLPETGPDELAELARRFNQMGREVQALLDNRTTLLAGVSHDLRTPLTRAQLALEMMKGDQTNSRNIDRISKDLADMNSLISGYLDIARSFKAAMPEDLDLADELTELASHVEGVLLNVRQCPAYVDREAFRRVVSNLLENALRYGGGRIEIDLVREKTQARILISDNGPGIAEEDMEKVFRPFYRVEASRARVTGGTGLGLAIVKQLAEANGWKISLRNREEGGLVAELLIGLASDS
jgi:two-component system osmolarity sensor histidine kinase EnvZ